MKPTILRRAGARLIDGLLLAVVGVASGTPLLFSPAWLVSFALTVYLYFAFADTRFGKTAGKAMLGLTVTSNDGVSNPSLQQSLIREAFVLAGAVPFAGPVSRSAAGSGSP